MRAEDELYIVAWNIIAYQALNVRQTTVSMFLHIMYRRKRKRRAWRKEGTSCYPWYRIRYNSRRAATCRCAAPASRSSPDASP